MKVGPSLIFKVFRPLAELVNQKWAPNPDWEEKIRQLPNLSLDRPDSSGKLHNKQAEA
jgi:hypothetical protein